MSRSSRAAAAIMPVGSSDARGRRHQQQRCRDQQGGAAHRVPPRVVRSAPATACFPRSVLARAVHPLPVNCILALGSMTTDLVANRSAHRGSVSQPGMVRAAQRSFECVARFAWPTHQSLRNPKKRMSRPRWLRLLKSCNFDSSRPSLPRRPGLGDLALLAQPRVAGAVLTELVAVAKAEHLGHREGEDPQVQSERPVADVVVVPFGAIGD